MKLFCCYLKYTLSKKFSLDADVFFSSKKNHVHIAFKIPISECGSFDRHRFYFGLVGKEKNIF